MYTRTVPMYVDKSESEEHPLYDDTLDANNVDNFNDFEDEQIIRV
ncbi:hypothetical protein [Coprobacter fastidiosus]|nr:hypothetical protein [Coprobacter fastidiosus]DAZ61657.1 MAG TPA: hypothetical protein [Caudoviricetes sp.]